MYYMLHCFSPEGGELAMLTYKRDHPFRSWASGDCFSADPNADPEFRAPPEPVRAEVKPGYSGVMAEFWPVPVPLMTKRLYAALRDAGVTNVDAYAAEIVDPSTNKTYSDYVAFNIVGKISAADLQKSRVAPSSTEQMVSTDFDAVSIDEDAARGALLFRLAESVNAIVVHDRVKQYLEASGIHTLTFIAPEHWAG